MPHKNTSHNSAKIDVQALKSYLSIYPKKETIIEVCGSLFKRGFNDVAIHLALHAVSLYPDNAELSMTAAALISSFTAEHRIIASLLKNVLRVQPDNQQVKIYYADALMGADLIGDACEIYSELITTSPDKQEKLCEHISKQLLDAGYPLPAYHILTHLFENIPEAKKNAALCNNMACALTRLDQSEASIPWYERAHKQAPDNPMVHTGYAIALLKSFHYKDGFREFAKRIPATGRQKWWFMNLPHPHQENLEGKKIILYQEQGFGDTLQFIRFLPQLIEKGAERITLTVPFQLKRILEISYAHLPQIDVQDPSSSNVPTQHFPKDIGYDYAAPIPDLPYIVNIENECDLLSKNAPPYLMADPQDIEKYTNILPPTNKPRIALVWAGEKRFNAEEVSVDKRRSTTLKEMMRALSPLDAFFINIQLGKPREELKNWDGQEIFDPMDHITDMADTAALMKNIDLLISVDTSPVHIAGALNLPVWMVSRLDACWRWGNTRKDSPWYPQIRIFRAKEKSFTSIMQEMKPELEKWISTWKEKQ